MIQIQSDPIKYSLKKRDYWGIFPASRDAETGAVTPCGSPARTCRCIKILSGSFLHHIIIISSLYSTNLRARLGMACLGRSATRDSVIKRRKGLGPLMLSVHRIVFSWKYVILTSSWLMTPYSTNYHHSVYISVQLRAKVFLGTSWYERDQHPPPLSGQSGKHCL